MFKRTVMASLVAAAALTTSSNARADILLSDFSFFGLSGVYEDWSVGLFTPGPDDFRVEATNFGGGWRYFSRCSAGVYVQNGGAGTSPESNLAKISIRTG